MKNSNFRHYDENRVNWQIKVPQVRVVQDERQLGVMPTDEARRIAQDAGLDLVEIAPQARPPVCRIVDYSRFKYEQQVKKKELEKKQRELQVRIKEVQLMPLIADHDLETKVNQIKRFLEDGMRVQVTLRFKGKRQLAHKDLGFTVISKVLKSLEGLGSAEKPPRMEGSNITCFVSPI